MRLIDTLVIHCSATPNGRPVTVQDIDDWHAKRGFAREPEWRRKMNPTLGAIGYHFVVYLNGALATGRHIEEVGAHVAGRNRASLGICMVGGVDPDGKANARFTPLQWDMLEGNVVSLIKLLGEQSGATIPREFGPAGAIALAKRLGIRIVGHRDLSPDTNGDGRISPFEWIKACPGFDVAAWLANEMKPEPAHVLLPTT